MRCLPLPVLPLRQRPRPPPDSAALASCLDLHTAGVSPSPQRLDLWDTAFCTQETRIFVVPSAEGEGGFNTAQLSDHWTGGAEAYDRTHSLHHFLLVIFAGTHKRFPLPSKAT
ncbi:hypothetical protein TgHK011_002349 [Trichoderma gracile]|nr:hypothetical protein TgHK011_002349 [Trichoderma gracile]